jgi:hypothetical protein
VTARARAALLALAAAGAACGPADPCRTAYSRRVAQSSAPYAGRWVVARGDTLTLPGGMGDRFRLTELRLDSAQLAVDGACRFGGALVFAAPRAETLAVTWFGEPERVTVFGWPADLGPFAGVGAAWWGRDSLRGAILFDERYGVQMRPGVTAEFVAARASR